MGALAAWLMYEYGRRTAGFDGRQAASERAVLQTQIDDQARQMRELRVQLAAGEEANVAQVRERSEVARTIGEMQAQLARAQQDLQFYRGIANPRGAGAAAVAVQQFVVLTRAANFSLLPNMSAARAPDKGFLVRRCGHVAEFNFNRHPLGPETFRQCDGVLKIAEIAERETQLFGV